MCPAVISITFDDGLRCQLERAIPILDQHELCATFFLVANTDPIHTDGVQHPDWHKVTWSQGDNQILKGMVQRGHEIGAHSVTHRWQQLFSDPKGEAEKSKSWIENRLDVEIPSYAYPFYRVTKPIKDAVVSAGYKQARGGAGQAYYRLQNQTDYFHVDSRQITSAEDVGSWLRSECWHVLTFHGIGTEDDGWSPIPVAEFARQMADLAKHRDPGAVEVVTFKDGADRLRAAT
jgi:peptidoglycan/xylan/chitin deacetylase (PgdA/CDA1 family)